MTDIKDVDREIAQLEAKLAKVDTELPNDGKIPIEVFQVHQQLLGLRRTVACLEVGDADQSTRVLTDICSDLGSDLTTLKIRVKRVRDDRESNRQGCGCMITSQTLFSQGTAKATGLTVTQEAVGSNPTPGAKCKEKIYGQD